jgi:hypothetical protein
MKAKLRKCLIKLPALALRRLNEKLTLDWFSFRLVARVWTVRIFAIRLVDLDDVISLHAAPFPPRVFDGGLSWGLPRSFCRKPCRWQMRHHSRANKNKSSNKSEPSSGYWVTLQAFRCPALRDFHSGEKKASKKRRMCEALLIASACLRGHGKSESRWGTVASRRSYSVFIQPVLRDSRLVINRSILIYMARSQFAVLNMLVLNFSPKHLSENFFKYFISLHFLLAIYWQETVERVCSKQFFFRI